MTHMIWRTFIISFATSAAYADARWRKIPRYACLFAAAAGLAFNAYSGDGLNAVLAALVAFGIGLGLFSLGAIGGGDVKLITSLAAMLRLESWLAAMQIAIAAAAVIAVFRCPYTQTL